MPVPPGQPVLQLRVSLVDVVPEVWRRLLVPGSVRLDKLHRMFQAAMGWEGYHLHCFEIGVSRFGMQFDEYPEGELDEKDFTVVTAIGDSTAFSYEYDFGDSWTHEVVVERVWRMSIGLKFGVCLEGANACPPEDCGGPGGYQMMLETLADPTDDDHEHMVGWVGGSFDATEFDVGLVNARLHTVR